MAKITRDMWYRHPEVLYNFITICRDREIVFLSKVENEIPVRNVMAHYMDFLKKNFDAFHFFDRRYNIYYSLARYNNMQMFSFNPSVRREQRLAWNQRAIDYTESFDFGLDFDADDLDTIVDAWLDCREVKALFDEYKVPYSLKFSGSKGFHLRVPSSELPSRTITSDASDEESLFNWLKNVASALVLKLDLPTIDLGIFDPRRIWKADYSWVCETDLIALPLSDEQFLNFEISLVRPDNVLAAGIRNRGILLRDGVPGGFRKLVEEELGLEWEGLNSSSSTGDE